MDKIRKYFSGISPAVLAVRSAVLAAALLLSNFGIGCYYACGLGTDPISVFVDGQHLLLGMTYGEITTINNVVLVVLILLFLRDQAGIGTIIGCFASGPLIDLFEGILTGLMPADSTPTAVRVLVLAFGCVVFSAGTGLYIVSGLGISPFDLPSLLMTRLTKIDLKWTRMAWDLLFFVSGWIMGGVIGIGTVAGVLLTGPIMTWVMNITGPAIEKKCEAVKK